MQFSNNIIYFLIIFMRMISACEDQITQTTACVELPIENYHIVAACHAFLPFHAYEQYKNGPFAELDFTKRIVYRGLFNLYSLVRQPIPKHIIDGWIFEPLLSTTGYAYNFINLQKESLIGIIGYNESKKIISISFRGTQCLSDWCNNMTFSQLPIKYTEPAVLLHGGYVSIFKHLKKDLYRKLLAIGYRLSPKEKKELTIILTGHSLGGAVASVTVPFIKKYFPTTHIKLVTFGAPKVGKQDYNNWLDENEIKVTSFVRKTDPAPYAPASLRNCMLGTVIWLHHFYHFLWPLVHDMRYYLKAMLNIYNQYRDIEDHVTYYDFYHVLLPGGIKL